MMQPFELLKPQHVERLIKLDKKYLVTQSYTRGRNNYPEAFTIDILVSDYDDLNYAQVHYNAVKNDKYASIIHFNKIEHKNKLDEMLHGNKFCVYWAVVKSVEGLQNKMNEVYADSIRKYISRNTSWRIKSDNTILPKLEVIFGELFIIIKFNSESIRVKFEEIEKM